MNFYLHGKLTICYRKLVATYPTRPRHIILSVKNHRSCVFRISSFAPNWAGIKQPVNESLGDEFIGLGVSEPTTERTSPAHTSNTTSSLGNSWAVSALHFTQDPQSTR